MFDLDHIKILVIKEITKTISREEQTYLNQIVSENVEADMLRRDLYARLNTPEVANRLEKLEETLTLEHIQQAGKQKKRITTIRIFAGMATLLVIMLGIYWFAGRTGRQQEITGNITGVSPAASPAAVALKLANGQVVDLSGSQQQVQAGNVTLNNANKTLSYVGGNAAAPEWATLSVPAGKDYQVRLSDGSTVQLNAASTLQFPLSFGNGPREITIHGEAYLKVTGNADQPFIVHLPGSSVQVLGTEFNVNTYDSGSIRVALVTGAVKIKAAADSLLIKPGFQGVYTKGKGLKASSFDADQVLSWRTGVLELKGATLQEVFNILPRWYGVTIVMDNKNLDNRRFTGVIDRNKPVETFLENLKFTHDIEYDKQGDIIHVK